MGSNRKMILPMVVVGLHETWLSMHTRSTIKVTFVDIRDSLSDVCHVDATNAIFPSRIKRTVRTSFCGTGTGEHLHGFSFAEVQQLPWLLLKVFDFHTIETEVLVCGLCARNEWCGPK